MWGKTNGCFRSKCLCPVSFGLAVGITAFFAVLIWSAWMMVHGSPELAPPHFIFTWGATFAYSFLALIKGFLFGFVVALLYDCFACWCKSVCCKREGGCKCGCGCTTCDVRDVNDVPLRK